MDIVTMLSIPRIAKLVIKFIKAAALHVDLNIATSPRLLVLCIQHILYTKLIEEIINTIKVLPTEDIFLLREVKEALLMYHAQTIDASINERNKDATIGLIDLCVYVISHIEKQLNEFLYNNDISMLNLYLLTDIENIEGTNIQKISGGSSFIIENKLIYKMNTIKIGKLHLNFFFLKENQFKEFGH